MAALLQFLFIYFLGGLTLLPLLVIVILYHAYLFLPVAGSDELFPEKAALSAVFEVENSDDLSEKPTKGSVARQDATSRRNTLTAGYFTVNREFVPGGISSRPSERINAAGAAIHNESLNVYQSMYRSIFDRGKSQPAAVEGYNTTGKSAKKIRNVLYIVLRFVITAIILIYEIFL